MARVSSGLVAACLASSATGWLLGRWTRRHPGAELRWLRQELTATSNALIEAEQERADARRAQRELIIAISHEMRTPLAGIRAAAEALQDGVAQEPQRYLDGLIGGAQRLNRVTGDLFELARLQVDSVERTPTRLADLLDSALAAALPVALERGVRLHGVGLDSATDPVRVDIAVLTRALANLVMHAVRHTVPGEPVTVTAMVSGDEIEVIVVDGCGGAAGLDAAAEPADSGLAVTRGLIRAHGGNVRVDQVTDGCRFTTRLPAGLT